MVMENRFAGFNNSVEWRGIIWLAGPNLTSVPFTRFLVEYMGRARSLDKLSSEWDRPGPSSEWAVE